MISVITPAHNEELFIEKCLGSVQAAAKEASEAVEQIVVLNRCTDRTAEIAIGILLKTRWLFTGFLRDIQNRLINFITMPGSKESWPSFRPG